MNKHYLGEKMGNYHKKKGKGKSPLFGGIVERVINIYGGWWSKDVKYGACVKVDGSVYWGVFRGVGTGIGIEIGDKVDSDFEN